MVELLTSKQEGPGSNPGKGSKAMMEYVNIYNIYVCPMLRTGKMRLVHPPASGASSMVNSWVKIRDSFSDMVRVMVSVRGRVWIG